MAAFLLRRWVREQRWVVIAAHWSPFLREKDVADPSLILVVARNIVITILWLSSDDDAHLCDDGRTTWAEGGIASLFRN